MAIIKCKMCGGDLEITEGVTVAECEYCGTKQTVPNVDNEKKLTLFSRANRLRLACEFDKAAGVYENIVAEFPEEAEAYWGLVLCRYGIEYVDDPATGKKVPTCHRSSFDSILEDSDFEQACENADAVARRVYRDEAKAIEDIRKGILEVSGKEQPYDIFICYKETDDSGERTVDSVLAQDVYDALTEKGYRVFFSRITLEDKLGTEYEPYIFAALNSAKIMLAFGTDYEYFNAVWVKNEWSRYLKLMAQDKGKHLIPCYKDVDAYDMPKEFQKLQGQDMGKVGAVQDLLRGIDKLLGKGQAAQAAAPAQAVGGPTVESLLKRGQMFLEDRDWVKARNSFDQALEHDPECAEAYVGKFCAECEYQTLGEMSEGKDGLYFLTTDIERKLILGSPDINSAIQYYRWRTGCKDDNVARLIIEQMEATGESTYLVNEKAASFLEKALRFAGPELRAQLESAQSAYEQKNQVLCQQLEQEKVETRERLASIRRSLRRFSGRIAAGAGQSLGVKVDGTVIYVDSGEGKNAPVCYGKPAWEAMTAIVRTRNKTFGLKMDGTVTNCDGWSKIVSISAGTSHIAGLREDGTAVATGDNAADQCNVSDWRDIVAVACGEGRTLGVRSDGTVVNTLGNVSPVCKWRDIVAVSCGDRACSHRTVGLRANGTVVEDGFFCSEILSWRDVVSIACTAQGAIIGLKADGTVLTAGGSTSLYSEQQQQISEWRDIVAIVVGVDAYGFGNYHLLGLQKNGEVICVGLAYNAIKAGKTGMRLFENLDTFDQEYQEAVLREQKRREREQQRQEEASRRAEKARQEKQRREEEEKRRQEEERAQRRAALEAEKSNLQTELSNLKGFFTGKRRKEIEARLAEIEAVLKKL